jgi:hypothetical protein
VRIKYVWADGCARVVSVGAWRTWQHSPLGRRPLPAGRLHRRACAQQARVPRRTRGPRLLPSCRDYLPRVWWTPPAIEALALGETVEPKLGKTITEQRANALFGWLRDFGLRYGWRQTGTLTKLQMEVNQGAIGLIIARRVDDGRPGHLAMVVPETGDAAAKRAANGAVVAPLQSQAGTSNVRRGTGKPEWWKGAQFAESAFWLHA